ncbi:hypothetical protein GCM10009733_072450 [Nonomuraea maheshkhaliensis]|uniref:ABC-three component systems C-terminal domain-containing protein n=1 Tax=Nonomuraea maheshkhaliensis TaxID=419590 RepID=A0ABN2G2G6_9ACTN
MLFEQRAFARLSFLHKLPDLYENAFEDFFHNLMAARYTDYVDIRTHGNIGDQGGDGLSLHNRRLYAVYAPQVFDVYKIKSKFTSDLKKAKAKRNGQFDTFVFVHNDYRGTHPDMASIIAIATRDHAPLKFDHMGRRRLWQEIMQLSLDQIEDLLGCVVPVHERTYGVGLEDLAELLSHLRDKRRAADPMMDLQEVSGLKLDYNGLDGESREDLVKAMKYTHLVDEYFAGLINPQEVDEIAAGFSMYYRQTRKLLDDPEDILWHLEEYVLGNARQHPQVHRAAWVVLAYFFERCDIFEQPTPNWRPATSGIA